MRGQGRKGPRSGPHPSGFVRCQEVVLLPLRRPWGLYPCLLGLPSLPEAIPTEGRASAASPDLPWLRLRHLPEALSSLPTGYTYQGLINTRQGRARHQEAIHHLTVSPNPSHPQPHT